MGVGAYENKVKMHVENVVDPMVLIIEDKGTADGDIDYRRHDRTIPARFWMLAGG